jgi:hypothetical protein
MKYLVACAIALSIGSKSIAQSNQGNDEEVGIACFFIDETTIACFQDPSSEKDAIKPNEDTLLKGDTTEVDKKHWELKKDEEYEERHTLRKI